MGNQQTTTQQDIKQEQKPTLVVLDAKFVPIMEVATQVRFFVERNDKKLLKMIILDYFRNGSVHQIEHNPMPAMKKVCSSKILK